MKRRTEVAEGKKDIKVKVFRFDPSVDEKPRYVTYEIPYDKVMEEKMTVLTALLHRLLTCPQRTS